MRTKRQTFNKIKKHLLNQKEQSRDELSDNCLYHSDNGLQCAVGCLISKKDYKRSFEHHSVYELVEKLGEKRFGKIVNAKIDGEFLNMLSSLQTIHDNVEPSRWRMYLKILEKKWFGATKKK